MYSREFKHYQCSYDGPWYLFKKLYFSVFVTKYHGFDGKGKKALNFIGDRKTIDSI